MPLEEGLAGDVSEAVVDNGSGVDSGSAGGDSGLPSGDSSDGADSTSGDSGSDGGANDNGGDGPARSMGKDDAISAAARKTYRDLTREQPRKDNGQFKKGSIKQPTVSKPAQDQTKQQLQPQQPVQQQTQKQPAAIDPNRVPDSWRSEAKAQWATLPPTVKAEINKREADYRNGHATLRQEIESNKGHVEFSRQLGEAVTPYIQGLQGKGVNIREAFTDGAKLVSVLHLGTNDERVAALRHIVKHFGIKIPAPGQAPAQDQTNQQPAPAAQAQVQPQQFRDPRVDSLLAERQQAQQREQQAQAAERAKLIDDFIADPANEHFGLVYEDMAKLIETGMAKDMSEAYEKAVRLNPAAFAAVQSKQEQKRREEAAKAAEEARRAAGAPRSSGKPANFQPPEQNVTPKNKRDNTITQHVKQYTQKFGRS